LPGWYGFAFKIAFLGNIVSPLFPFADREWS